MLWVSFSRIVSGNVVFAFLLYQVSSNKKLSLLYGAWENHQEAFNKLVWLAAFSLRLYNHLVRPSKSFSYSGCNPSCTELVWAWASPILGGLDDVCLFACLDWPLTYYKFQISAFKYISVEHWFNFYSHVAAYEEQVWRVTTDIRNANNSNWSMHSNLLLNSVSCLNYTTPDHEGKVPRQQKLCMLVKGLAWMVVIHNSCLANICYMHGLCNLTK